MQILRLILIAAFLFGCGFLSYTYVKKQYANKAPALTDAAINDALERSIDITSDVMADASTDPILRSRRGGGTTPRQPTTPSQPSQPTQPKPPKNKITTPVEQETIIGLRGGKYEYDPNHPIYKTSTEAYF